MDFVILVTRSILCYANLKEKRPTGINKRSGIGANKRSVVEMKVAATHERSTPREHHSSQRCSQVNAGKLVAHACSLTGSSECHKMRSDGEVLCLSMDE